MMWKNNNRHAFARIAMGLSAFAVLLAVISRFTMKTIVITQDSLMLFAIVSILFAIYFRIGGMAEDNK
jgi:hypothetical protein